MNNRILSEEEIVNALVEKFQTMEYLKKKDEEYMHEYAASYCQGILREKWRNNVSKYRENHRDKLNAYSKVKNNKYYHENKEEINRKRAIKYKEKKEEKRLKDLAEKNLLILKESLGESQKIDS